MSGFEEGSEPLLKKVTDIGINISDCVYVRVHVVCIIGIMCTDF